MNSDAFYPEFDDGTHAYPVHELDGWDVEPPVVPADPMAWQALAAAYNAHHFSCPACIAASRGRQYGERCAPGLLLWAAYQAQFIDPLFSSNPLPVQEYHDQ
ncbi:hypothetical protein [Polaromonas sp. CG9_12]|nr:hypothetical protein [Polaromonas sp. CG9_12]